MSCPDVSNNSDLLEGKPRGSAILKTLIDSINSIIQDDLVQPSCDIEKQSSILTATGIWLDYIGDRLKYPRLRIAEDDTTLWFGFDGHGFGFDQQVFTPGVDSTVGIDDESYRALLIVRGGQLLTDCSIPSLNATLQGAFGTGTYIDHGNMSISVILDDSQPDVIIIAVVESGLLTKPAGVRINDIFVSHGENTFGFDGNGVGFDQGLFVRTFEDLLTEGTGFTYLVDDDGKFLTDDFGNFLIT